MNLERVKGRIARDRARVETLRSRWILGDVDAGHEADQLELELERLSLTVAAEEKAAPMRAAAAAARRASEGDRIDDLGTLVRDALQARDATRAEHAAGRELFARRMKNPPRKVVAEGDPNVEPLAMGQRDALPEREGT